MFNLPYQILHGMVLPEPEIHVSSTITIFGLSHHVHSTCCLELFFGLFLHPFY